MVNYAIQYDGSKFYILDGGPMASTVSELIRAYMNHQTRLCIKTLRTNNNDDGISTCDSASSLYDNNTSIPLRSVSRSNISTGPRLPEKPKSFLYLKRPVGMQDEIRA